MKKTIFLALLLTVLVSPAWAVETGKTANREGLQVKKAEFQESKEKVQENREEARKIRCEAIGDKLNYRVSQSEKNRDKHYTAFQNIRKHIDAFITRATARGCDVTTLKTQLTTLDGLIEKFAAAFRDWKTSVQAAREHRCDSVEAKTTETIQVSATKYQTVRETAEAVRTYVKNTVKPTFTASVQSCKPEVKGNE